MRFSRRLLFSFVVGASFCASACNNSASVDKASLAREPRPHTPPDKPPVPAPAPAGTFAQSLETLSFIYDPEHDSVRVSFSWNSPDYVRPEPQPGDVIPPSPFEPSGEFVGKPGGDLKGPENSQFRVKVECADRSCSQATIEIDKLTGALAGRATLKRAGGEMSASSNRNLPDGGLTSSQDALTAVLAELNCRETPVVSASVIQLQGETPAKSWFKLSYQFDRKRVDFSGALGKDVPVTFQRAVGKGGRGELSISQVSAKVRYRETPMALTIEFDRPDLRNPALTVSLGMSDSLAW